MTACPYVYLLHAELILGLGSLAVLELTAKRAHLGQSKVEGRAKVGDYSMGPGARDHLGQSKVEGRAKVRDYSMSG